MGWLNLMGEAGLRLVYPGISRELGRLRRSQWDHPEEIRERSWQSLRQTLRYASDHVPFYRRKFELAGLDVEDIRRPEDLAAVPITTKQELREALAERWPLSAAVSPSSTARRSTTGSSGEPFIFPIDGSAQAIRMAAVFRNVEWYGHRLGDRNARLWGKPEQPPDSTPWSRGVEAFKRDIAGRRLDIFTHDRDVPRASMIDRATLERWAGLLRTREFKALDGYVNALVLLARHILDSGETGISCEAVVTGAEYLAPAARELLERAFGCPVYNRYGCSEAGFIAHECGNNREHALHVNAELLWLEFLKGGRSVAPGELGEIVLTDFSNRAMPLIRYRTNDVGVPCDPAVRCPCGRGLPLVSSVEGRVDDLFYLPSGEVLISHVWHEIFADQDFVRAFRVTQHRPDYVEVEIVPRDRRAPRARYQELQAWVSAFLPGCTVTWSEVDEIVPGAGGKLRTSRSLVAAGL